MSFTIGCHPELVYLKQANVDFEHGILRVQNDEGYSTKKKESSIIPMHENVVK